MTLVCQYNIIQIHFDSYFIKFNNLYKDQIFIIFYHYFCSLIYFFLLLAKTLLANINLLLI